MRKIMISFRSQIQDKMKANVFLAILIVVAIVRMGTEHSNADVYSPWIISEHVADTSSMEAFANFSAWKDKQGQERAIAIWKYLCDKETGVFHFNPVREGADRQYREFPIILDPIKMLNTYGYGYCGSFGPTTAGIFKQVGFEKARAIRLPGPNHCVTEVWYDDDWHYFDVDLRGILFENDGTTVASVDDVVNQPDLWTKPSKKVLPFFPDDHDLSEYAHNYGSEPVVHLYNWSTRGATMDFRLRKGESLTRWWQPQGGRWSHQERDVHGDYWVDLLNREPFGAKSNHPDFSVWTHGNGLFDYQPTLRKGVGDFEDGVFDHTNVALVEEGVALNTDGQGEVIFEVLSPYVIVPKVGDFETRKDDREASVVSFKSRGNVQVFLSLDFGRTWQSAMSVSGNDRTTTLDLTPHLRERYQYLIKFVLSGKSHESVLETIRIQTWTQVAPASLPRLKKGINHLSYKVKDKHGLPTIPWMQIPNMASREEMKRYWALEPKDYDPDRSRHRVHGDMVLRFKAPAQRKIKWASLGGFFNAHQGSASLNTKNEIWYAINDSDDWNQLYSANVPNWNNHGHYAVDKEVVFDKPVESIKVRYVGDPGVNTVRVNLHSLRQDVVERQTIVATHGFEIGGQLVQRRFTFDKPSEYAIDCDQTPVNVFVQIAVPSDSADRMQRNTRNETPVPPNNPSER